MVEADIAMCSVYRLLGTSTTLALNGQCCNGEAGRNLFVSG